MTGAVGLNYSQTQNWCNFHVMQLRACLPGASKKLAPNPEETESSQPAR